MIGQPGVWTVRAGQ